MPPVKVKVPEYPRPVSPVSVDEIPVCPDTIIYYDGRSESDEDAEQRAAKRRRIESYATSYLRGETLFIATAQLRGPFKDGWQNPWAKRKTPCIQNDRAAMTVSRKDVKNKLPESPARSISTKARPTRTTVPPNSEQLEQPAKRAESLDEIRLRKKDHGWSQTIPKEHGKNRKVEDWLKRNSSYDQPEHQVSTQQSFSSMSSPTYKYSQKRWKTKKWESSPIHIDFPPVADAVVNISMPEDVGDLNTSLHNQHTRGAPQSQDPEHVPLVGEEMPSSREGRRDMFFFHEVDTTMKRCSVKEDEAVQADQEPVNTTVNVTATRSILTVERETLQIDDPSDALRPMLGAQVEPEQRLGALTDEAQQQVGSKMASASLHTASEGLSLQRTDDGPPSLSQEASRPSIIHNLPSAQVQVQPTLHSIPSYLSSNAHLLQELSDQPAPTDSALNSNAHPTAAMSMKKAADGVDQSNSAQNEAVSGADIDGTGQQNPAGAAISGKEQTSQAGVSSTSAVRVRSTQCSPAKAGKGSSPKTTTKEKIGKHRKKTAFVADEGSSGSSQGSIKMVMKVAKPSILNQDRASRLKIDLAAGTGGITEEHLSHTSALRGEDGSKLLRDTSGPRGILRSSLKNSVGPLPSLANDTSSWMQHDAQRPLKLTEIENGSGSLRDDGFDSEAVMDDLGSFLRTWDSEKEAAGL